MFLTIKKDKLVKEIQKEFASEFPYLKLEFFPHSHAKGEGSMLDIQVKSFVRLGSVTNALKEGSVKIKPTQTVAELEALFQSQFHLPVQVFRKGGGAWLETTETDHFTLAKQNAMGAESARRYAGQLENNYWVEVF